MRESETVNEETSGCEVNIQVCSVASDEVLLLAGSGERHWKFATTAIKPVDLARMRTARPRRGVCVCSGFLALGPWGQEQNRTLQRLLADGVRIWDEDRVGWQILVLELPPDEPKGSPGLANSPGPRLFSKLSQGNSDCYGHCVVTGRLAAPAGRV